MTDQFDLARLLEVGENAIDYAIGRLETLDPALHAATVQGLADGSLLARLIIEAGRPSSARLWLTGADGQHRCFEFTRHGLTH